MSSEIKADKWSPASGTSATIGDSGDTITVPSGATFNVAGTLQSGGAALGNTPFFYANMSGSDQTGVSSNTWTKVQFNNEVYDPQSVYDPSSNYRFTPTVAGKYVFNVTLSIEKTGAASGMSYAHTMLYKNGTKVFATYGDMSANYGYALHGSVTAVVDMNGSSDYVEAYGYANTSVSSNWSSLGGVYAMFSGYKLTT